ncbi:DUF397 domain-containing protein [Streptomyces fuscigenes]|uniref:DUF397 domain-containing protein n=1 Tax=Streptomyces fuscigenes TaxID=1528880 RepID=UPI001F3CF27A|nr:DUF397 domain-containing protein [Streptomyces fuscigenes]MCF3962843.1 DUF397 domain-containing protein [Streptomyces fuscigenes]
MDAATAGDMNEPQWIKSSHSSNDGPQCVEVARTTGAVLVRDSKDADGPRLTFAASAWSGFLGHTAGE